MQTAMPDIVKLIPRIALGAVCLIASHAVFEIFHLCGWYPEQQLAAIVMVSPQTSFWVLRVGPKSSLTQTKLSEHETIEARRRKASAFRVRFSKSLARRRQRLNHAKVRSTTQRRGRSSNPLA